MTFKGSDVIAIAQSGLWFLSALGLALLFKDGLRELLRIATWRIRTGSQVKIASFELGASYVSAGDGLVGKGGLHDARADEGNVRFEERRKYYEPNRRLFLVHKVAPSKDPEQLYDILIYLVPHHKEASLAAVSRVEYYFGKSWGSRIFASIDRATSFSISTSAYGPFVCTASIHFTDGESVMLSRYIDFEMGAVGRDSPRRD